MSWALSWNGRQWKHICSINVTTVSTSNDEGVNCTASEVADYTMRFADGGSICWKGLANILIFCIQGSVIFLPHGVILCVMIKAMITTAQLNWGRRGGVTSLSLDQYRPQARLTCQRSPGPAPRPFEAGSHLPCPPTLGIRCLQGNRTGTPARGITPIFIKHAASFLIRF